MRECSTPIQGGASTNGECSSVQAEQKNFARKRSRQDAVDRYARATANMLKLLAQNSLSAAEVAPLVGLHEDTCRQWLTVWAGSDIADCWLAADDGSGCRPIVYRLRKWLRDAK